MEGGYSDEEWLEDEVAAAEDEAVLAKFMAPGGAPGQQQRTLSDIIMERIRAKQAGDEGSQDDRCVTLRLVHWCRTASASMQAVRISGKTQGH